MVYLVGGGPGDPGLLTVKGQECLAKADVVVYDRLLDDRLLEGVRRDAERIYVGKAPGRAVLSQEDIGRVLVKKAHEGKMVVRLKGGDPFVFGRGGEEAEDLARAGIPFEIVPGVTAAIAAPAYAGIPVTHRNVASSLAIITGHEDPRREVSRIDWERLVGADTMVLMMAVENLPQIVEKLLEFGRPANNPVAIIERGTRPGQRTLVATLATVVKKAEKAKVRAPAAIVIGRVVNLRRKLRWFDNRPLFGKRILVTRSRQQASALSALLARYGAEPVEAPSITLEPVVDGKVEKAIAHIKDYSWLVFTSVNAVEGFFRPFVSVNDGRALSGIKLCAIGPATAAAFAKYGLQADFVPEEYTTEAVVSGLKKKAQHGKVLLVRAEGVSDDMATGLAKAGVEADQVSPYRAVQASESARVREMLEQGEIDMITFTSSSTVSGLVSMLGNKPALLKNVKTACIGPVTAQTARELGLKVNVEAPEHTIPGLVRAIVEYYSSQRTKP